MKSLLFRVISPRNLNGVAFRMSFAQSQRCLGTSSPGHSVAISQAEDDADIRSKYRPFLLGPEVEDSDWISELELETVTSMVADSLAQKQTRPKVLVLYGSLRKRSLIRPDSCFGQISDIPY